MKNKILIGRIKKEIKATQSYNPSIDHLSINGEAIYLEKHSFDCGWYWGFGYIGNNRLHTHAEVFIKGLLWHEASDVFERSIFARDCDFWVFKDLLKQAYSLQATAEVFTHGGHCKPVQGLTDVIASKRLANTINKKLEIVLNTLWDYVSSAKVTKHKKGV